MLDQPLIFPPGTFLPKTTAKSREVEKNVANYKCI